MTDKLSSFAFQLAYLLTHLTLADVIDIALVAVIFFAVLNALRRTRSLQLLRGVIVFSILGMAMLTLLPLSTFNWLLRSLLLAGVVAWPMIFQDDLRRALAGLGQIGRRRQGFGFAYKQVRTAITSAVSQLSSRREGALVVLEGVTPLAEIIATGIQIQAESLSTELLVTLFHPKTPLHDGAVILRGSRLVAAGCILPVQTEATGVTHLGTRHRAALGLASQVPDALIVVVSEETGNISVAQGGQLQRVLSKAELGDRLDRFQKQLEGPRRSGWQIATSILANWLRGAKTGPVLRNLAMGLIFAVIAWVNVVNQTNPPQQATVRGVPLAVAAPPNELILMNDLPETVRVEVQTTRDRLAALDTVTVRAELDLANLPTGVHRVPVDVVLADKRAQVISFTPSFIDVTLEPIATLVLSPTIIVLDPDSLPPGHAMDELSLSAQTVTVRGPQSLVGKVAKAEARLTLNGRRTDFQQILPLMLLDNQGRPVTNLELTPETIMVTVPIRRTFYTRQIPVQATLAASSLETGHRITQVRLSPPSVTLIGSRSGLDEAGDFLVTAPISLTGVRGDLVLAIPLILPEGVSALDSKGEDIINVDAHVTVEPVTDYLVLTRRPTLSGLPPAFSVQLVPDEVSVLLTGPQPLLAAIQETQAMVAVYIDLESYKTGTYLLPLTLQAPEGLSVELFPPELHVTLEEKETEGE